VIFIFYLFISASLMSAIRRQFLLKFGMLTERSVTIKRTGLVPDRCHCFISCFWCADVWSSCVAAFALNTWCLGFNWINRKQYVHADFETNSSGTSTGVHSFGELWIISLS